MIFAKRVIRDGNEREKALWRPALLFVLDVLLRADRARLCLLQRRLFARRPVSARGDGRPFPGLSGRFLQPAWRFIRGRISAPWLLGALSLLFIALSAYLVIPPAEAAQPTVEGLHLRADGGEPDRDAAQRHLCPMGGRLHAGDALVGAVGVAARSRRPVAVSGRRGLPGGLDGAVSELCLDGAGADADALHRPGAAGAGRISAQGAVCLGGQGRGHGAAQRGAVLGLHATGAARFRRGGLANTRSSVAC